MARHAPREPGRCCGPGGEDLRPGPHSGPRAGLGLACRRRGGPRGRVRQQSAGGPWTGGRYWGAPGSAQHMWCRKQVVIPASRAGPRGRSGAGPRPGEQ
ncbi:hypothetical protein NDU88_006669 [Pleurodeles waltl]|uniref:Uncharacterized protein n=1 Tax=Pleurodeles waltl TaxID=8319 RepID=A0AAV7RQU4_PLEWA|nr:hypothetical protein NDU88_006669 [Pleurodeles waltl]